MRAVCLIRIVEVQRQGKQKAPAGHNPAEAYFEYLRAPLFFLVVSLSFGVSGKT